MVFSILIFCSGNLRPLWPENGLRMTTSWDWWIPGEQGPLLACLDGSRRDSPALHIMVLLRSPKLSLSESHIFKTVSQELCQSDGRSRHIAEAGRHPCQAFSFYQGPPLACLGGSRRDSPALQFMLYG